jgi:thiamine-phosphate pyrophosphorylase
LRVSASACAVEGSLAAHTAIGFARHFNHTRPACSKLIAENVLLYYITDRKAFPGDERTRRNRVLAKIAEAATQNINYIQLREKDLPTNELESLAREAVKLIQELKTQNRELTTALLINSRTDVAQATAAAGVHLPANDVTPQEVRKAWKCGAGALAREISPRDPVIAVSCHSAEEVIQAAKNQATLAVFAPVFQKKVFEKKDTLPQGLKALTEACQAKIPVLALGGITLQNAASCLQAGAAGIAAIRLFQENDVATIVRKLRA